MTLTKDEIVISGISGKFPESANMKEFRDNLINHVNMVTVNDRRFKSGIYGLPEGFGALKEIDKFDADFFKVLPKQASRMDPQLRMMLETTFEAMLDAGVNPIDQQGSRTGVFAGACSSDAQSMWNIQSSKVEGATMTGCTRSMFANRISFAFDFNGPSCAYDTACSSSMFALEAAVSAMRDGKCDAAIVTGSTLILDPHGSLQFQKLGMLAPDFTCKAFDCEGKGYVRSESVASIYLQKRSVAKRAYASIIHVKTNTDGFKSDGITYPSAEVQEELLQEVYNEAKIDLNDVTYIETHGTGTPAGDPQEFLALYRTFGPTLKNRTKPLYLGSLKSNMGHAEGASGVCSIAKIVIMLQEGIIPANLHYEKPHFNMKGIREGKIQIVSQNTDWNGGLVALNSFGFGGVNTHVILKPHGLPGGQQPEILNGDDNKSDLLSLITVSGRTEIGVQSLLAAAEAHSDKHLYNLINDSYKTRIHGHTYRGFSVPNFEVTRVEECTLENPEVWFVFNGMGSQWAGMGKDLLQIPVFARSIQTSARTLKSQFNYDLMDALNNPNPPSEDPLYCFVTITAIQIGIVDVLSNVGVRPKGFIGHSAGEMICAYVDGCFSAEETITCSYLRGISLVTNDKVEYGMAVIGDTWSHLRSICPEGIYLACNNGSNSVTMSGPKDLLQIFIKEMKSEKRMAQEVNSCGIAFHTPYIATASKTFHASLDQLIKESKVRSKKWVSSSVTKANWSEDLASSASPEYFVNNFMSPVLFYEALKEVPEKATVIEIGPSGLLKGLIKKGVPKSTVISVQSRDSKNGLVDFVSALGQIFISKVDVDVNKLYGEPQYPVPQGTPMISPLITWDHGTIWDVPIYGKNGEFLEGSFDVDVGRDADKYLTGHQVQGRLLFPATGYLVMVWKFFAQTHQAKYDEFPVVFENIRFRRVTVLRESATIDFRVNISDSSGNFEIKEGEAVVVTGKIRRPLEADEAFMTEDEFMEIQEKESEKLSQSSGLCLVQGEVYKQYRFLGYEYSGLFRGITKRDEHGRGFLLSWSDNWIAFLDTFLQTTLGTFWETRIQTELPTEIQRFTIFPKKFLDFVENNKTCVNDAGLFAIYEKSTNLIRCAGIEVCGLKTTSVSGTSRREPPATLSTYTFRPFIEVERDDVSLCPILQTITIIMENIKSRQLSSILDIIEISELSDNVDSIKISNMIRVNFATPDINYTYFSEMYKESLQEQYARACINLVGIETISTDMEILDKKFDILILDKHLHMSIAFGYVRKGGFILLKLKFDSMSREQVLEKCGTKFSLIAQKKNAQYDLFLIRKNAKNNLKNIKVLNISSRDLSWVPDLRDAVIEQENLLETKRPLIYLVSNGEDYEDSGILGLTLCIRKEPFCQNIRSIFSRKKISLDFSNPDEFLMSILTKDLAVNIVDADGRLGSYFHSPTRNKNQSFENAFVGMDTVGDLSTLRWIQGFPYDKFIEVPGYTPVKIHVAALNFKDIMLSSGNLHPEKRDRPFSIESPLGFEYSGVTVKNERVCGYVEGQALATDLLANLDWIWKIPKDWSFEDAATIPVVYSTVYLALVMRGQIQEGESILIHAGAGGVGQAAIRVALSMKCQVFTTVGAKAKITFMTKTFPEIPQSNIGYSRDTSFEKMVLRETKGRGVDLVLNSLAGDKLDASVRCLARHGRFLEIGKVDLISNKALGMLFFLKDASYHGVMLDSLSDALPSVRRELKELVQIGLESGVVKPLPYRLFTHEQVEPAFRYMGQGKHIGKVLIKVDTPIPALPHVHFNPFKSYIIIGGLGGVGLEFVNWMTTRNAKKLVLTTRTGITTAYQATYIRLWKSQGVTVRVLQLDASDPGKAKILVDEAQNLGPLGGFFNLAMQLHVDLMKHQTKESFGYALDPKVKLTQNIDELTRKHCPELEQFVVFSSVASGFGFDGQVNYGQANSAAERIIEKRCQDGFPGKAIQWGPIGEVGAWHDEYNADFDRKSFHGSGVQSLASVLKSFDTLFTHEAPVMLSRRTVDVEGGSVSGISNLTVAERVAHVLGHTTQSKLNPNTKLIELGMDSVMSMEIKQILEQDFYLTLSASEIRSCTLKQLEDMSNNNPKNKLLVVAKPKPQAATSSLFQLNFLKNMSRSRFFHDKCVYPINDLSRERHPSDSPSPNGTVFIINSVEGPEVLYLLAKHLQFPTYCMQMPPEFPENTVQELAEYYHAELKAIEPYGPYIIIGYSAGVFIAIELGLKLHTAGENQKLVLLDMTPGRFDAILEENVGTDRSELDEIDALLTLFSQVFGFDRTMIEAVFRKETTLEKRAKKASEILSTVFDEKLDESMFRDALSSRALNTLKMYDKYKPSKKYDGNVILIRTTQNLIAYDSNEYWGLDELCTKTPVVRIIDTTHSYIVADGSAKLVADYINFD